MVNLAAKAYYFSLATKDFVDLFEATILGGILNVTLNTLHAFESLIDLKQHVFWK